MKKGQEKNQPRVDFCLIITLDGIAAVEITYFEDPDPEVKAKARDMYFELEPYLKKGGEISNRILEILNEEKTSPKRPTKKRKKK